MGCTSQLVVDGCGHCRSGKLPHRSRGSSAIEWPGELSSKQSAAQRTICLSGQMLQETRSSQTNRARTAISRTDLSRPLKRAITDGIVGPETHIFDYGCGRGDDVRRLRELGYQATGWDPVHRPDVVRRSCPIVNLGYVVNVIENVHERHAALRRAWSLSERVLIVSARLTLDGHELRDACGFSDGHLTSHGTFQKFFEQHELHEWINQTLRVKAVPAAPGIFYVFRDEKARSSFIAAQYRRRSATPHFINSEELFHDHRELLGPLMNFVVNRGRVPFDDELSSASEIIDVFGSIRRAFRVISRATDDAKWKRISRERGHDLLVYLALSQFDGRLPFGRLSLSLQRDVKAFFGAYKRACAKADELLFSLGKPDVRDAACTKSSIGKLTPSALYVHESALSGVSTLVRLYEGCARGYVGRIDGANIVKLHLREPMVSYLSYPEFEKDPHPALAFSLTVQLQTFRIRTRDYSSSTNRPILHRKELFVAPDYPAHKKFARLTRIEEGKGLYEDTAGIGFENGWKEILARKGLYLKGHRLLSARSHEAGP